MAYATFTVNAGAYIFNSQKKLLLLKNRRGTWGIVGGHVEAADATLEETLAREVLEETGLHITIVGLMQVKKKGADRIIITYVAKVKGSAATGTTTPTLSDEHSDFAWVTPKELGNYDLTFSELPKELELAKKLLEKIATNQ